MPPILHYKLKTRSHILVTDTVLVDKKLLKYSNGNAVFLSDVIVCHKHSCDKSHTTSCLIGPCCIYIYICIHRDVNIVIGKYTWFSRGIHTEWFIQEQSAEGRYYVSSYCSMADFVQNNENKHPISHPQLWYIYLWLQRLLYILHSRNMLLYWLKLFQSMTLSIYYQNGIRVKNKLWNVYVAISFAFHHSFGHIQKGKKNTCIWLWTFYFYACRILFPRWNDYSISV